MATIHDEQPCDLGILQGKTIAGIGYGSQGRAPSLNLRDSGLNVVVGLHIGRRSRALAERDGLRVTTVADAAAEAAVIMTA